MAFGMQRFEVREPGVESGRAAHEVTRELAHPKESGRDSVRRRGLARE
jgi:hypothetical protein